MMLNFNFNNYIPNFIMHGLLSYLSKILNLIIFDTINFTTSNGLHRNRLFFKIKMLMVMKKGLERGLRGEEHVARPDQAAHNFL